MYTVFITVIVVASPLRNSSLNPQMRVYQSQKQLIRYLLTNGKFLELFFCGVHIYPVLGQLNIYSGFNFCSVCSLL